MVKPKSLDAFQPDIARMALFLDVDGTLLEIASHPDAVTVPEGTVALLHKLSRKLGGALALITGRTLADLDRQIVGIENLPAAGMHGLERRLCGNATTQHPDQALLRPYVPKLAAFVRAHPGTWIEDKGATLALHFRSAPEVGTAAFQKASEIVAEAQLAGVTLSVLRGKMIVEIRPAGIDKGRAMDAFLAHSPFLGRVPVFIGDDVTDEDGFAAASGRAATAFASERESKRPKLLSLPPARIRCDSGLRKFLPPKR